MICAQNMRLGWQKGEEDTRSKSGLSEDRMLDLILHLTGNWSLSASIMSLSSDGGGLVKPFQNIHTIVWSTGGGGGGIVLVLLGFLPLLVGKKN